VQYRKDLRRNFNFLGSLLNIFRRVRANVPSDISFREAVIFSPDIPSLEISFVGQTFAYFYFEEVENSNPEGFFPDNFDVSLDCSEKKCIRKTLKYSTM
jgi:hypothetical protein